MYKTPSLQQFDPEIFQAVEEEEKRQEEHIELIASENYVSPLVLEVQGSVLTNKYAEGYPGKRYYGGCEFVDVAEKLAIERVKKLFGADYANVQPHSGSLPPYNIDPILNKSLRKNYDQITCQHFNGFPIGLAHHGRSFYHSG